MKKFEEIDEQKILNMSDGEFFAMYGELDTTGTKLLLCAFAGLIITVILLIIAIFMNTFFVFSAFFILFCAYMIFKRALKYKAYAMSIFKLRKQSQH